MKKKLPLAPSRAAQQGPREAARAAVSFGAASKPLVAIGINWLVYKLVGGARVRDATSIAGADVFS